MSETTPRSPRKRIAYIDILEVLAIFLVVYCHFSNTKGDSVPAHLIQLCSFTLVVPLFLMANGTLLFHHSFDLKKHVKRTLQLLIAVTVWRILYYIIMDLTCPGSLDALTGRQILDYIFGYNLSDPLIPADHFWYLYALIVIYLCFPVLKKVYDMEDKTIYRYVLWVLFILVFGLGAIDRVADYIAQSRGIPSYSLSALRESLLPIGDPGSYLFYFMLGPLVHDRFYQSGKKSHISIAFLVMAASFALLCLEKKLLGGGLTQQWELWTASYSRLGTLGFSLGLYILAAEIRWPGRSRLIPFLSMRTMNIYCIHMILSFLWVLWIDPRWHFENLGLHLIRVLIVFAVSVLITELFTWIPGVRWVLAVQPKHPKK